MRQLIAALFVGTLLAPQVLAAQSVMPGGRVRVSHPGEGTRIGTVVSITTDTLEVRWSGNAATARMPLAQLSRLEVSHGLQRRSRLSGTGTGFLVGAGVGGVLGGIAGADCSSEIVCPGVAGGALIGGLFFGAVGGLVGTLIPPGSSEIWERVSPEPSRVAIVAPPRGGGKGVGIAIAF